MVFSAGSPTLWGLESAGGETSQDEETEKAERESGMDRRRGPVCGGGPGESGAQRRWPPSPGVDVQLALENVVDDWLGQVIHDVAIPVLQSQTWLRRDANQRASFPKARPEDWPAHSLHLQGKGLSSTHCQSLPRLSTWLSYQKKTLSPLIPPPS